MEESVCENEDGTKNTCEDLPVRYCRRCNTFYAVNGDTREEILIEPDKICEE